jgi:hypothetical protein
VDHAQAADTDQFMQDALGRDSAKYLSLNVDGEIPTWVFQQRQFSVPSQPATAESVPAGALTVAKLPLSVLKEVGNYSDESFVSLWSIDPVKQTGTLLPAASWQPAIFLRFLLRAISRPPGIPSGTQLFEIVGTPEGDRWFLDQLGLLPGPSVRAPANVQGIFLTLERKDSQGNLERTPALSEWSIARTNLTQESRPAETMGLATDAPPASLPYIVLSGDPGQEQDALRLLEMASITNSGGYYLAGATDWDHADSLVLAVLLTPRSDPDTSTRESAWLPLAANALALPSGAAPNAVRFNGLEHIEISPYTPPGTVPFGWTRAVPKDPTTHEDKFGFGTLSIVDWTATDGSGHEVPTPDAIPIISPMRALPGDHYEPPATVSSAENLSVRNNSAAMRVLAAYHMGRTSTASLDETTETHYYRGTLVCYDRTTESPWERLRDPNRRQILIKPGLRDVFGNRFDLVSAPVFQKRLFYTDPIISPTDWPGLRFGVYPEMQAGQPRLTVELLYDYKGFDPKRAQRLREIRDQLRGVAGDVTVSFLADPIVIQPKVLDIQKLIQQLDAWASGNSQSVLPLASFQCDGVVGHLAQFEPRIHIERKPDYLPTEADLPSNQTLANLIRQQLTSVTVAIALQTDAAPTTQSSSGAPERQDDFGLVAQKLQAVVASACGTQVGFLRDHVNVHEIWLVPDSLFPSAPALDVSAAWSFATPCPLRNVLGNESFQTPDFTKTTTTNPAWNKYKLALTDQVVVDQDFDELGRIAFRLLESETGDLTSLMLRVNAVTMRSLLKFREDIAKQLATFNATGQGPGFVVSLLEKPAPGDLDPAAVSRIARDAFLSDLSSFYTVSTILQLPLSKPGDRNIQTFQGKVAGGIGADQASDPNQPTFSDILLGGADPKVTVLYDLPPNAKNAADVPPLRSLTVNILHVQLPLPGALPGASPFNEGPWIELAAPVALTWKGLTDSIPVAARAFPEKPIIRTTEATLPVLNPQNPLAARPMVNGSNAALLSQWGWRFSFSLVNGIKRVDTVHVTIRYPQYQPAPTRVNVLTDTDDWTPVSLLNALVTLKLLRDNWDSAAIAGSQLAVLNSLVQSLLGYLSSSSLSNLQRFAHSTGGDLLDVFALDFQASAIAGDTRQVMQGPVNITWTPPSTDVTRVDTATLEAPAGANGNTACLTGNSPVRGYKVSLILKRNETFLGQAANKRLIYQCAPVESPLDCRPLNLWGPLVFDMTGQSLRSALQGFFGGIFHQADLSQLNVDAGISLIWTKGSMAGVTPFSILPADIKPGKGTVPELVQFVSDKCKELVGGALIRPSETDSASIRLRVKITAADKDTPSGSRTLIDAPATDFELPAKMAGPLTRSTRTAAMTNQTDDYTGLQGVESEFATALLQTVRTLISEKSDQSAGPVLFPHGVGTFELTASVEPQKISLSVKIADAGAKPAAAVLPRAALEMAPQTISDDILNYCVSLDTTDNPVMKDCNAFVKNVGSHFGVTIPDLDADGIVDSFPSAPFSKITMDPATAMLWARDGLVVAGMKKSELNPAYGTKYDHGHLAIVHATEDPAHPGYPMASWGSLGGRGKSNTSIRYSFPAAACNDHAVHFAFAATS